MFLSANSSDHHGAQTDGDTDILKKPRRANIEEHLESRFDVELNDRGYHESSTSHWPRRSNTDSRVNSGLVSCDQSTSSSYESHSTDIANKSDPPVDSYLDHCGSATGPSNLGSHSTNTADKLDLRYVSDQSHHGTYTGHRSIKYEHRPTNYGPHSTNIVKKLDPRFDSGQDYSDSGSHDADYPALKLLYKSSTLNNLDPRVDSESGKCTCCKIVTSYVSYS